MLFFPVLEIESPSLDFHVNQSLNNKKKKEKNENS